MKTILVIFVFIMSMNMCYAQYRDTSKVDYNKIYWMIDEIINRADNIDSLVAFLKDSNNTVENTSIRYFDRDSSDVIGAAKELSEHILKNDFQSGYNIETKELRKAIHIGIYSLNLEIKIRSKATKDIILFFINNHENGVWKLSFYTFCTNYYEQIPDINEPCRKD